MTDKTNDESDIASGGAPEPDNGDVARTDGFATGAGAAGSDGTGATGTEEPDGTPVENPSGG